MIIKVAFDARLISQQTDQQGFAITEFGFAGGGRERVKVKLIDFEHMSRGFTNPSENRYAKVSVYQSEDGKTAYVIAKASN